PPQEIVPPHWARKLPYAKVTSPEDPPLRPERHVPNSIATMRRRLVAALATTLSRCPCCAARNKHRNLWHSKNSGLYASGAGRVHPVIVGWSTRNRPLLPR